MITNPSTCAGPRHSSELTQRDVVWDESAPHVPGVLPSPCPQPATTVCCSLSLLDWGVLAMLAWSVHLPGPRCHIKQPLLTELTWEHKCWCTSDGFAFLLFLMGHEVRKPGNSAELWSDTLLSCSTWSLAFSPSSLPVLFPVFFCTKEMCVCKYRNSVLFKVLFIIRIRQYF